MTKKAKFAGVHIVFNFTVEDEEGDVTPFSTQAQPISAKDWRTAWETDASRTYKTQVLAQLEPPAPEAPADTNGNGNRAERRRAVKKREVVKK